MNAVYRIFILCSLACSEQYDVDFRTTYNQNPVKKSEANSEGEKPETDFISGSVKSIINNPKKIKIVRGSERSIVSNLELAQNSSFGFEIELFDLQIKGARLNEGPKSIQVKFGGQPIRDEGIEITATNKLFFSLKHTPEIYSEKMFFKKGESLPDLKLSFEYSDSETSMLIFKIRTNDFGVIEAKNPTDENKNKMIYPSEIFLPVGFGVCILNKYKDKLVIHGRPHQNAGRGMKLGECYDKYGGGELTIDTLDKTTPCSKENEDNLYDHDNNVASSQFKIICRDEN